MTTQPESNPVDPQDAYAVFCGQIDESNTQELMASLTTASRKGQSVHLLFQSSGGHVGDGICLYNFFRSLPIELTVYNVGAVFSAGVIAYLGAKRRIASKRAIFMIHRVTGRPGEIPAMVLKGIERNLRISDGNTESILAENVTLPEKMKWSDLDAYDFYFSGEEAAQIGLAHEIGEFAPPRGTPVYYFSSQRREAGK
jgi:ATP-dependent protease ClpP protease subunit